jgi:hypothetical protein
MTTYMITRNHQKGDDFDTPSVQQLDFGTKMKNVSFQPHAKVWIVESYPQELHEGLWYSSQDYQEIKRQNAHEIQEAQRFGNAVSIKFRPSQYRGLERALDESRKIHVFRSIQAVLMEQNRQQIEQDNDLEALANVYQAYCVSSVENAIQLANLDKRDAQQAMDSHWMEHGGDSDNSVQCMEYDCSDSSVVSDSDSLQVVQQRRRKRRWIFPRQKKYQSDIMTKKTSTIENDFEDSTVCLPHLLWMNLLNPMIPICG